MKNLIKISTVPYLKKHFAAQIRLWKHSNSVRSLDNLNVTPERYGPLLIPVLQSKFPSEWNFIISRHFDDFLDCWDVTEVLKVFKEELSIREKTFSPEPDSTNYIA